MNASNLLLAIAATVPPMTGKDINQVLAENLSAAMGRKGLTQTKLGELAGMGQTTVSLYLRPHDRKAGKSGKAPSGKLTELEALARALGCEPAELLSDQAQNPAVSAQQQPDWRTVALMAASAHPHESARTVLLDFIGRVDKQYATIENPTVLA